MAVHRKWGIFCLLFLGIWLLTCRVYAETEPGEYEPVIVRFFSEQGEPYTDIQATVTLGGEMQAPDIPERGPASGCGWKTMDPEGYSVEVGEMIRFTEGETVLSYMKREDGKLCLDLTEVRGIDLCEVLFYEADGDPESRFLALEREVPAGTTIELPSVPGKEGYEALGWSDAVNAETASFKSGEDLVIEQNQTFYAVRKALPVRTLRFSNNGGTGNYSKLKITAYAGAQITLPEVPKLEGYTGLGWATAAKAKTAVYTPGQTIILTKNTKLYAVREKTVYYTATFYKGNGITNSKYEALTICVPKGTKVTLPDIPYRVGYVNMGWATQKNAVDYNRKEGSKVLMDRNRSYYAVQQPGVTLTLYNNSGSKSYGSISVLKGDSCRLPGRISKMPYTFMGWSTSKGKKVNPTYEVGETLTLTADMKLYACVFNRDAEPSLMPGQMLNAAQTGFDQIIFVGDSRTRRMHLTLEKQYPELLEKIQFIEKSGQGLNWLMSEDGGGMQQLMQMLDQEMNPERKTAIVFNFGVNDLSYRDRYVEYMTSAAPALKARGCTLYYMSVNPLNNEICLGDGRINRPEENVRLFNQTIMSGLKGEDYRFIDTYSYLMRTGYGTDSGAYGEDSGVDDGLHYSTKTYKRIFAYVMEALAAAAELHTR